MSLYLAPWSLLPAKIHAIEQSAVRVSQSPSVRAIAREIRAVSPTNETDRARSLLARIASPAFEGNPSTRGTDGQWVNTDVVRVTQIGGDCVERTHALLALARALDIPSRARWFVQEGSLDHVVAQLFVDGRWQWADGLARPAVLDTRPQGVEVPA